jgi:hypothetical protein
MKLARGHAAILLGALLLNSGMANDEYPAGMYHVDLAWNASPSPEVSHYRIHFGTTSGTYTEIIEVGNVTQAMVPGLENGVTYFFAVGAVSPTGEESELSNEVSYLPGIHKTGLHTTATGEVVVTVRGLIGQSYEIEASEDLETWTLISTVTVGESGSLQFTDPQAADFPKRFYRTREAP